MSGTATVFAANARVSASIVLWVSAYLAYLQYAWAKCPLRVVSVEKLSGCAWRGSLIQSRSDRSSLGLDRNLALIPYLVTT
jgi:hypothetical protein